jgi:hypothetical protein
MMDILYPASLDIRPDNRFPASLDIRPDIRYPSRLAGYPSKSVSGESLQKTG